MDDCYNFTINETNKHMNHCLDKCIQNYYDNDNYDDYNKGARGAEALANKGARGAEALVNDCYCKCISKLNDNDGYGDSDGYSDGYSGGNVFTAFFIIIIFLLTFCLYGFIKAKLQTIYATNEINSITINNNTDTNTNTNVETNENANTNDNTNRLHSNTGTVNYYTIDNSDNTQDLPKYNDIDSTFTLPPKYNSNSNSNNNTIKSNYTNEMM